MLLTKFLEQNYEWAQDPHLYIVEQIPQILNPPAHRCGAAGTYLYRDSDEPFKASENSQKGLQGRMTQYNNYFLPNVGKIHACLRMRKQLVALENQRVAGPPGQEYNVDHGQQTEVLAKEKIFHHYLDELNLRWRKETRKELFVPTGGVQQLVGALRRVQGLQLLLFDEDGWIEDTEYTGGERPPPNLKTMDTNRRTTAKSEPSIVVTLSAAGISQLKSRTEQSYRRLVNLVRDAFNKEMGTTDIIRVKLRKKEIEELYSAQPQNVRKLVQLLDEVLQRNQPSPIDFTDEDDDDALLVMKRIRLNLQFHSHWTTMMILL